MGVKKLLKFLTDYSGIVCETRISDYKGKKIAIDISLMLYQIVIGFKNSGSEMLNEEGKDVSHILGLFNKIIILLTYNIFPVFIFDGKPSKLKADALLARKKIRENALTKMSDSSESLSEEEKIKHMKKSVFISKNEMDDCRELLTLMGIPFINAPEEADSQCAYLARMGYVDGVYTDDMDILTFGSPKIIKNLISLKNKPQEINLNTILDKLNLSYNEFIDFCILLGCDYSNGISNINYQTIYKYYSENKNINDTLINLKKNNYNVPDKLDYEHIKEYYLNAPFHEIDPCELKFNSLQYDSLLTLLVTKYGLTKFKIVSKLKKIVHIMKTSNVLYA
jgi:flap endonuclease-1